MTERDESYGAGLAELMNPEVARNPQPIYSMLQASMPVFRLDGVGVIVDVPRRPSTRCSAIPNVFSSSTSAHDLKAKRPLIPLQIDPPDHQKYRKTPRPALRAAADEAARGADDPAGQRPDRPLHRPTTRSTSAPQFSMPFPSQVFLTLLGLPIDELPRFLDDEGRHHPARPSGRPRARASRRPRPTSRRRPTRSTPTSSRCSTSGRTSSGTTSSATSSHGEVDGDRLTVEEILDICFLFLIAGLDTVTATLDCFFGYLAEHPGRTPQDRRRPGRVPAMVEELLRWETPVMGVCPRRDPRHRGRRLRGQRGRAGDGAARRGQRRRGGVRRRRASWCWDREANRHLAFGGGIHRCLGSHLARLELRVALREWHRRIPDYRVKPGAELDYTAGIRTLDTFPMLLGAEALG